jgi:hypothetical protein
VRQARRLQRILRSTRTRLGAASFGARLDLGTEVIMPDKRMYLEKRIAEGDYAVRRAGSKRASAVKPTQKTSVREPLG